MFCNLAFISVDVNKFNKFIFALYISNAYLHLYRVFPNCTAKFLEVIVLIKIIKKFPFVELQPSEAFILIIHFLR